MAPHCLDFLCYKFPPFSLLPSFVALIQSLPSPLFLSRSPRFSQLNSSGRRLHFAVSFLLERTRTSFYLIPATSEWLLLALRALYSPAQNVTKLCPWESHPCVTRAQQCACFQNQRLGTFTRTTFRPGSHVLPMLLLNMLVLLLASYVWTFQVSGFQNTRG